MSSSLNINAGSVAKRETSRGFPQEFKSSEKEFFVINCKHFVQMIGFKYFSLSSDRNNVGYNIPAHCNRNKLCPQSVTFLTFSHFCCLYILNSRIFSRKTRPAQQIFVTCPSTFYPTHTVRFIRIFARDLQSVNTITCKR